MAYDPLDYYVGWRDIAAGLVLSVIAIAGLLALGSVSSGLSQAVHSTGGTPDATKTHGCCQSIVAATCASRRAA